MPHVSQTVGPLIGGVSQAPPHARSAEFATELTNGLAHPTLGLTRRPGRRHVAKLSSVAGTAKLFPFIAGDRRRYFLAVSHEQLRVVEAETGAERPVTVVGDALKYLTTSLDYERPFAAATVGNSLYILNRERAVRRGDKTAPVRQPEALVAVRAADFATTYTVKLNGQAARYTTPDGTSAEARSGLSTDRIAEGLGHAIRSATGGPGFRVTVSGSSIHVTRPDGADFDISIGDGLADAGLVLVKGAVKSALDLPPTGVVDGFTARVQGDPSKDGDDYWLMWDRGVWRECARPGSTVSLDGSTLPHVLSLGGALRDGFVVPPPPPEPSVAADLSATGYLTWSGDYSNQPKRLAGTAWADFFTSMADGSTARVDVRFDVDTTGMEQGTEFIVRLVRVGTGGAETVLRQEVFPPYHTVLRNQVLSHTDTFTPTTRLRLKVEKRIVEEYPGGPEPLPRPGGVGSPVAIVNGLGPSYGAEAGLRYVPAGSMAVAFPPDSIYPAGAAVSLTCAGETASYTVPDSGMNGSELADALAAVWPAGTVTLTNAGGGSLLLKVPGQVDPPATTATLSVDSVGKVFFYGAPFTPGELVGRVLLNVTTGARTTITANTASTLSYGALTGGSADTLREGDVLEIVEAPDVFTFRAVQWEERVAGDDASNPFPSFVGRQIDTITAEQNRLVFTSGENTIASGAGKLSLFFRTTTQMVLDSDPIDVRGISNRGLPYYHAVNWNGAAHLLNGKGIYEFSGGGAVLTPRTVGIRQVFDVAGSERCEPIVAGRRLYLARVQNGFTQLLALEAVGDGVGVDSADATASVPTYLRGEPVAMAADPEGVLVIITEDAGGTRHMYAMRPVRVGSGLLWAWSEWTLDPRATPLSVTTDGGDVALVVARPDGVYLEALDTLAFL